ncbi:hypothetical protein LP421_16610 [Rhizobium sp. RCAM05350]|nr:hypothetical protein LP421_16610 [Rhizobium sp. RCAM05350]
MMPSTASMLPEITPCASSTTEWRSALEFIKAAKADFAGVAIIVTVSRRLYHVLLSSGFANASFVMNFSA